jgi:hypothetical protein
MRSAQVGFEKPHIHRNFRFYHGQNIWCVDWHMPGHLRTELGWRALTAAAEFVDSLNKRGIRKELVR